MLKINKSNNINKIRPKDCIGCLACVALCPKKAIVKEKDKTGFWVPRIDDRKCINCGLCLQRCPARRDQKSFASEIRSAHMARNQDREIRNISSSGGIFYALAKHCIEKGGSVYGAAFDAQWSLKHCRITAMDGLPAMMRSKYLQSDLSEIYQQIKQDLRELPCVLFVGTGCQVAGLTAFLGNRPEHLICCDLICMGVPSPGVFERYRQFLLNSRPAASLTSFCFRHKEAGWKKNMVKIEFSNGETVEETAENNWYFRAIPFCFRSCCNHCRYSSLSRTGDITLGDFWGIERHHPEWDDDTGTSAVLLNTPKGEVFLGETSGVTAAQADLNEIIKGNPFLVSSIPGHIRSKRFFGELTHNDFANAVLVCEKPFTFFERVKWSLNRRLRSWNI